MAALRGIAAMLRIAVLSIAALGVAFFGLAMSSALADQASPAVHLGVATCSGSNCHGATERPAGSAVPGNEFIIWSKQDKHRKAYSVLLEERAVRIARAIGLPD